jgi:hypothetical protein
VEILTTTKFEGVLENKVWELKELVKNNEQYEEQENSTLRKLSNLTMKETESVRTRERKT